MTMPGFSGEPPKDVLTVDNLGNNTQNLNPSKTKAVSTNRMSEGFLGSNAGLAGGVVSTATNIFGNFIGKIADDTDPTTVADPQDVSDQVQGFFSNPATALLDTILGFLAPILQGVSEGLTGLAATLAGLFQLRWDQVDSHDYAIGDLQDKTQQLEGVIGYGCRYMSSSPGVNTSPATMPFNTQVGPVVGCELMSGGKTKLLSKGLWRFEAQVVFRWAKFAPPGCFMDIVIRDPGGSEFTRLKAKAASDEEVTVTNVMPVVVPSAGYTAEVQAWTSGIPIIGGSWRSIGGGFTTTRFSCFKISDETS